MCHLILQLLFTPPAAFSFSIFERMGIAPPTAPSNFKLALDFLLVRINLSKYFEISALLAEITLTPLFKASSIGLASLSTSPVASTIKFISLSSNISSLLIVSRFLHLLYFPIFLTKIF